jgi:hypothetical protein
MTTNTVTTERRSILATVVLDCPAWCTNDHGTPRTVDDVWHSHTLAGGGDDSVDLTRHETDDVPEVRVWLGGNQTDLGIDLDATALRRLGAMLTTAADSLDALTAR